MQFLGKFNKSVSGAPPPRVGLEETCTLVGHMRKDPSSDIVRSLKRETKSPSKRPEFRFLSKMQYIPSEIIIDVDIWYVIAVDLCNASPCK